MLVFDGLILFTTLYGVCQYKNVPILTTLRLPKAIQDIRNAQTLSAVSQRLRVQMFHAGDPNQYTRLLPYWCIYYFATIRLNHNA